MRLQEPGFEVPIRLIAKASHPRFAQGRELMVGPGEIARRARGRVTHRLESLPILALSVHSACNCRCVMCDIWKANADKREISADDLERHVDAIRALRVQRVMLTGGEPLLHRNLWALCRQLQALGIRITLVTTGLLIDTHAADIAACGRHGRDLARWRSRRARRHPAGQGRLRSHRRRRHGAARASIRRPA